MAKERTFSHKELMKRLSARITHQPSMDLRTTPIFLVSSRQHFKQAVDEYKKGNYAMAVAHVSVWVLCVGRGGRTRGRYIVCIGFAYAVVSLLCDAGVFFSEYFVTCCLFFFFFFFFCVCVCVCVCMCVLQHLRSLEYDQHNPAIHYNLGLAYKGNKQLDEAITRYDVVDVHFF